MIKKILQLAKITSCVMLFSTFGFAQTVINNGNYTFSGLYTPAPPVLDGDPSDACWTKATLGGEPNTMRYNTVTNTFATLIAKENNDRDGGTVSGNPPPKGILPGGVSASFSIVWDQEYLYFIVKVVDPRLITRTASNSTGGAAVELFFNNGNGRSAFLPGGVNFPRKYNSDRDMQAVFNFSSYSDISKPIVGESFQNFGIPLNFTGYNAVAKGTSNGYIVEGRISWAVINIEFINPVSGEYTDVSKKPLSSRIPFGLDVSVNVPNSDFSSRGAQLMWNQCCWNTNWTQSQHFGVLTLAGAPKVFPATGITISEKNNGTISITSPSTPLELKGTVNPDEANQNLKWSIEGTSGSFQVASIDVFGKITPLNNGVVTVSAATFPFTADGALLNPPVAGLVPISEISQTQIVTITGQVPPTAINITAPTIDKNWGSSLPSVSVIPSNAPSLVTWSMIDPGGLASMNTLTGQVTSKSINNGSVTIVGTSLANGLIGYYTLPIIKQSPVDCFALNAYTNVNQTLRTKTNLTFSGFNSGAGVLKTKIQLLPQYINQYEITIAGVGTTPGNLSSVIPDDLVTITAAFGTSGSGKLEKTGSGWEISFNNQQANPVTITAVYLNNTSVTSRIIGAIKTTSPTTSPGVAQGVSYDIRNKPTDPNPGCNPYDITIGITPLSLNSNFQLYPNPASESITISAEGIQSVSVLSLVGSEVLVSNVISDNITLSTLSLSSGIYLVKVKLKGGQVSTQKLIISK
ncbi:MAG: T9SS C-terminal target domain-containing protein [Bacteroidetes bacterium]|nr:MAG: T9SS C-terminal target domain-containing protein [Bacteroidota bacterium]